MIDRLGVDIFFWYQRGKQLYKYILFDRSIRGIEIILGNGEVIRATAEHHRDQLFTAAGSCGSIRVITLLTNNAIPGKVQSFDVSTDPWFYMHAEDMMEKAQRAESGYEETIPVQSYLFRYDRGIFWSSLKACKYFFTPCNCLTRYLLDAYIRSRTMVHALHPSGLSSQTIIQDCGVPYNAADEFIRWTDELCPVRSAPLDERSFSQGNNIEDEMLLDIGI
jgi:delta24-sterol reductase